MDGIDTETKTIALFAMPEPLIALSNSATVLAALERAFVDGDPEVESYGGTPDDLLRMVVRAGPLHWEVYVPALIALFGKYELMDKLGQGLTQSIVELDGGDHAPKYMTQWSEVWAKWGAGQALLEIPIEALSAAVLSMVAGNDRPLFELPLEIRNIVRPLLQNTLGPVD